MSGSDGCACVCHDRYLQGISPHYTRNCYCKIVDDEETTMSGPFDDPQELMDATNKILETKSESKFNSPVWYQDTQGNWTVIPRGFKEVLDHIDGLEKNWDTFNQIETFMVKLKEMVAWNEERKRKEQELGKSPIKCDCVCHTVYRNSSGNLNHVEDDCHCGGRPNL